MVSARHSLGVRFRIRNPELGARRSETTSGCGRRCSPLAGTVNVAPPIVTGEPNMMAPTARAPVPPAGFVRRCEPAPPVWRVRSVRPADSPSVVGGTTGASLNCMGCASPVPAQYCRALRRPSRAESATRTRKHAKARLVTRFRPRHCRSVLERSAGVVCALGQAAADVRAGPLLSRPDVSGGSAKSLSPPCCHA